MLAKVEWRPKRPPLGFLALCDFSWGFLKPKCPLNFLQKQPLASIELRFFVTMELTKKSSKFGKKWEKWIFCFHISCFDDSRNLYNMWCVCNTVGIQVLGMKRASFCFFYNVFWPNNVYNLILLTPWNVKIWGKNMLKLVKYLLSSFCDCNFLHSSSIFRSQSVCAHKIVSDAVPFHLLWKYRFPRFWISW